MSSRSFSTGNSKTKVVFDDRWRVADLGSGHNPHARADILVDKYLLDNAERSGAPVVLLSGKSFVIGDGCAMPFKDKAFDFVICSHVIEHIAKVDDFCSELNRVAAGGYLECPSKLAELLRHAPNHRWYVSNRRGRLVISPTPNSYPLGWFGRLFFSLYFYNTRQVIGRDVLPFAKGVSGPLHYFFAVIRESLTRMWIIFKALTYTRLLWQGSFAWQVMETEAEHGRPLKNG
jgi:SAM-dependent methyltransferase